MPRSDDLYPKTAMQRYLAYLASRPGLIFVLFCLTACYLASAGIAWGGTIKGIVRYTGAPFTPKKLPVTADRYVCGESKDAEDLVLSPDNGIRNAAVSLQSPPPGAAWPAFIPIVQID